MKLSEIGPRLAYSLREVGITLSRNILKAGGNMCPGGLRTGHLTHPRCIPRYTGRSSMTTISDCYNNSYLFFITEGFPSYPGVTSVSLPFWGCSRSFFASLSRVGLFPAGI